MRRIVFAVSLILVTLSVAAPSPVRAVERVIADLDGRPISVSDIPRYFCTDRDFPLVHCYRTAAALEASPTTGVSLLAATLPDGTYLTVYSAPTYGGSYMHITQNYDTLFLVGWNDRIRSYKGRNNAQGTMWTDWLANGVRLDFCCNTQVPIMGSSTDHQVTSVYRR